MKSRNSEQLKNCIMEKAIGAAKVSSDQTNCNQFIEIEFYFLLYFFQNIN